MNRRFSSVQLLGLSGMVYAAGRWLEERPPGWARTVGRWLLSLGLEVGPPSYGLAASSWAHEPIEDR